MEKNHSNPFHLWFSLFGRDASCCRPTENREGHCRRHLNRISKLVTQNQDSLSCHPLFQLCHPALCVWIALALALLLACMQSSQFFGQLKVMEKLTQTSLIFISILSAIILINDLFENYKYHCLPFFLLSQVDHHQVYLSVPNVVNKGKNLLILHSDKQLSTKNKNAGCINHGLYEN